MFRKTLTPRISELNGARHIGHYVIPVWLEEGYIEILRLFNPNLDWDAEMALFLVNMNIDYKHEMVLGQDVEVITGVRKIGRTSVVLQQKIFQAGTFCGQAASTFVYLNSNSKKSAILPLAVVEKLKEHIIEK